MIKTRMIIKLKMITRFI